MTSLRASLPSLSVALLCSALVAIAACSGGDPPTGTPPPATTTTPDASPAPADAAASDGATPDASPAPDSGADAALPTYCEHRTAKCGRTQAACDAERACLGAMRSGLGATIERCVVESGKCNTVDDCIDAEAVKLAADPTAKAFTDACLAKRAACSNAFSDDLCVSLRVFDGARATALDACLSKACADVKPCFEAELAAAGCN